MNNYEDDPLCGPDYPMPPGGHEPMLNLATLGMPDVASGSSITYMPAPEKVIPPMPTLSGSPEWGGIDPSNTIPDLNLAGVDGMPTPDIVARPNQDATPILPDYHEPDFGIPVLAQGDLTGPGITKRDEFAADPAVPDLSEYSHPYGLTIMQPTVGMSPDPLVKFDEPTGLDIMGHDLMMVDPMVPDLQNPDLTQQTHMLTRPGDMDKSALDVMDPGTQAAIADKDYPEVYMDGRTNNSRRTRDMTLLMDGLRDEER